MGILREFYTEYSCMDVQRKEEFLSALESCLYGANPFSVSEKPTFCPHCRSRNIRKNGFYKDTQKFKCKVCMREFRMSTNTCMYYSKKPKRIRRYLECMINKMSVSKTAEVMRVSERIVFQWRHKLLEALSGLQSTVFTGHVTLGVSDFKYSTKGLEKRKGIGNQEILYDKKPLKIALLINSEGDISMDVCNQGRLISRKLRKKLAEKIDGADLITTKRNNCITRAVRFLAYKHEKMNSQVGINNALFYDENSIKKWLTKFRGVASKYLQHYLNWFVLLWCYESPRQILQKLRSFNESDFNIYMHYKYLRDLHAFKDI